MIPTPQRYSARIGNSNSIFASVSTGVHLRLPHRLDSASHLCPAARAGSLIGRTLEPGQHGRFCDAEPKADACQLRTVRRIRVASQEASLPALSEIRHDSARVSSSYLGGVRRWLHRQRESQGTAGLVSHALHPIVAPFLSPFVAGVSAPCRASCSLQPLEEKALRESHADWHRFCLLLK
jgi:hypothetical protein